MGSGLKRLLVERLSYPEFRGLAEEDFDRPDTTALQRKIYLNKPIVRYLYRKWGQEFVRSRQRAPKGARILEIGSGIGQLKEFMPEVFASDVTWFPWLDLVCSAFSLPFASTSLDRIFALFVLHHLSRPREFLDEAYRCLKPGGEMVVLEPAVTPFSRLYYRFLHPEDMDPGGGWGLAESGRLSGANCALPWIIFFRDRKLFCQRFPRFVIRRVVYVNCLAYLLSGGLRLRSLLPEGAVRLWSDLEDKLIARLWPQLAVSMVVVIGKE